MSILNGIFGELGHHVDVANMAQKLGIEPALAEKAIAALGQAHQQEGDTLEVASAKTGLDSGTLGQIVEHIGGEGSLGEFARALKDHPQASGLLGLLDRDGDGNPLDDIAGMAKGLFGKD
jgi:hypothetical protein